MQKVGFHFYSQRGKGAINPFFSKFPEPTSLGAPGATLLDGVTLVVEISSLQEGICFFFYFQLPIKVGTPSLLRITGFPTTPGPTEPAPTTDRNFINADGDVVMMCRLKGRIAKLNGISSNAFSLPDKKNLQTRIFSSKFL